jgi:hypothetical protein
LYVFHRRAFDIVNLLTKASILKFCSSGLERVKDQTTRKKTAKPRVSVVRGGGLAEWPQLRKEMAELRNPAMELEQGQVKQVLEEKGALAARLKRSPDLLDALLMRFTFFE